MHRTDEDVIKIILEKFGDQWFTHKDLPGLRIHTDRIHRLVMRGLAQARRRADQREKEYRVVP